MRVIILHVDTAGSSGRGHNIQMKHQTVWSIHRLRRPMLIHSIEVLLFCYWNGGGDLFNVVEFLTKKSLHCWFSGQNCRRWLPESPARDAGWWAHGRPPAFRACGGPRRAAGRRSRRWRRRGSSNSRRRQSRSGDCAGRESSRWWWADRPGWSATSSRRPSSAPASTPVRRWRPTAASTSGWRACPAGPSAPRPFWGHQRRQRGHFRSVLHGGPPPTPPSLWTPSFFLWEALDRLRLYRPIVHGRMDSVVGGARLELALDEMAILMTPTRRQLHIQPKHARSTDRNWMPRLKDATYSHRFSPIKNHPG